MIHFMPQALTVVAPDTKNKNDTKTDTQAWWKRQEKYNCQVIVAESKGIYRQVSNIRRTKFQHLKDSCTVLRLSLPNPLKSDVKSRMKM